jgi:dephospho-CoA kinase
MRVAFLLGLTGSIACGKSTVGQMLAERFGADYIDADRVVHALYAPETSETRDIAARFGAHLLQPDGTIDRRRLADIVLSDPQALRELERILDPGARRAIDDRIANTSAPVVVLDAVRLIEGGLYRRCDAVWVVVCDTDLQMERLQRSRNFSPDQAALRVTSQPSIEEKLRHATAVIENNGSVADLSAQVEAAWDRTVAPYLVQSSPP